MDNILSRTVQIGTVTAVDTDQQMVRVKFLETDLVSAWLLVPQRPYSSTSTPWLPEVNDTVLVLYLPVENSDGFVLGAI